MADVSLLVCGGCGFIGSNFVRTVVEQRANWQITVVDALSYAGWAENLGDLTNGPRVRLYVRDISEYEPMRDLFYGGYDIAVNFAAETHVDRSLYNTSSFVKSNIVGVDVLLALTREYNVPLLQISTDEVYGAAGAGDCFTEESPLRPSSPYAASKAAADLLVQGATRTFGQNTAIVRTTNNYGPRQFPEKLIPYFVHLLKQGQALPVYGDGLQKRCWLHVEDFCFALLKLIEDFPTGEILNIGATCEHTNLEIVEALIRLTGGKSAIKHVTDRPAHDRRYWIDSNKYTARYGALAQRDLQSGLEATVRWYLDNPSVFERMKSEGVETFRQNHYNSRS
ncbi:MAG: GDP-mannose 4,6-dehydratase [Candidatus Zixiibacteriota bacterium]